MIKKVLQLLEPYMMSVSGMSAGVEIVTYKVIYDLVDEMRARMEGRLATVDERIEIGEAEVRAVFGSSKGKVAGCLVTDGYLRRDCLVDVRAPCLSLRSLGL